MLKRFLPARLWWTWVALVAVLGISIYFISVRVINNTATNQVLKQEQIIARAEASNISSFFQDFGQSVAVLAQLRTVENPDANTLRNMQAFVDQWRGTGVIGGVLLLDKNGVVIMNANVLGTKDVGTSLADRDYFIWAKSQTGEGKYFVGQSVVSRTGASKGMMVTVVASPIFKNGVFVGAMGASVELQPLTKRFLGLMKISDSSEAYLIGANGDLLVDTTGSGSVGASAFGPVQILNFLNNNQAATNKLKKALDDVEEGDLTVADHLVAYAPVTLANKNWLLVMVSPAKEIAEVTAPIHVRQVASLLLIALSILVFGIVVSRESQIKRD